MAVAGPEPQRVILVVEDEPGIRGALELLLGLEGFTVVTASNGVQALEVLSRVDCDLIITDHMMPLMDGPMFLGRLRADERLRRVPALMISAVSRPPEPVQALADGFVAKPFEIPELLVVVRRLLREGRDPQR